ncbi:glycoside hydrolase family 97 N-terminal domain-containing protein [Catenovulum agarivorans]|uniref:glycoside hydrolase family 97 N-terminal domain-containing protein n=1 Tax=Catenovulum agarivorans TaxID=1172192 RepID=UPI00031B431E|nr:glycoside hydrolase family 97 N-terminal domain-containing protein [Catenovulum agarivorans]
MRFLLFNILLCLLALAACGEQNQTVAVVSPNKQLEFKVVSQADAELSLQILRDEQFVWQLEALQLNFVEHRSMQHFEILKVQSLSHSHMLQHKNYAELFVVLKEFEHSRIAHLRVRAFDSAVAFRYEFPTQSSLVDFSLDLANQTLPSVDDVSLPDKLELTHYPQYPSIVSPWFIYQL